MIIAPTAYFQIIYIVYDSTFNVLNYGYALLEAECLRAINKVGLDAHVGFLHEINPSKNSV